MGKRKVEVFSASCSLCDPVVQKVQQMACSSCEVTVVDVRTAEGSERARALGVHRVPAVAVDGKLVDCCQTQPVSEELLRQAGIGSPCS